MGVRKWVKILFGFLLICQYPFVSRTAFGLKYLLPSQVLLLLNFLLLLAACCALFPSLLNFGSEFKLITDRH